MKYRFLRFPEGNYKAVTFSYDDCPRYDIKLVGILNRYGIKCTFNVNSAFIPETKTEWHLSKEEIAEYLLGTGHEIAVHGAEHRAPGKQRAIDGIQDVLNCRLKLEKSFGRIIRGMAYPDSGITSFQNGASYENIRKYLADLDIVYSRTLGGDNDSFQLPDDWYAWMPTAHHTNPKVLDYIREFSEITPPEYIASRVPRLFYLWGHSFEFENNHNWELMVSICEQLGRRDDCWYATNLEIYNYVAAYRSLIFSADSSIIYNPTLLTVWFECDGKLYSVKSGETITV